MNNAARRDASPLECSRDFRHGLLGVVVVEDVHVEAVLAVAVACELALEPAAAHVDLASLACGQQRQVGLVVRYGQQRAVELDHRSSPAADPRARVDCAGRIVHLARHCLQVDVGARMRSTASASSVRSVSGGLVIAGCPA